MIKKNLQEFYRLLIPNSPLIAIDYGSKKLGIALSNQERSIAMPLNTITEINKKIVITSLLNIIEKYKVCGVIIGLPIDMRGAVTEQTNIVMKFAEELAKSINLPIYLQDERLTTKAANNFLKSFGVNRKDRNNNDDAVAASMILETVLDSIKNI
ncbi:Holliday junction resolvase RuvX [Rickettsia japonica]|uniref:Putative pre-16S rRNA nuclease n=2 Tax=Rickettsia japonica TaxID=35790 RepID=A0AAD1FKV8_RICJA|nr:Holliday junction resolvase RuvX [Rickettsia japonica]AXU06398.1 Holliday junction resolvase RuvX [Rickettsia japonica]QHE25071.1 Holliday junction resolvase RuvX [Rickettsia japonica]BAK96572.1 Holliday junction resolvase-like protein [Rickettsia japonica YH]BAW82653.1 Holliday junction resolvase-like protein [Rickettsia japonica]